MRARPFLLINHIPKNYTCLHITKNSNSKNNLKIHTKNSKISKMILPRVERKIKRFLKTRKAHWKNLGQSEQWRPRLSKTLF